MGTEITLDCLIEQGENIQKEIYLSSNYYYFKDHSEYTTWKNTVIRFLSVQFKGDRCINDFEEAAHSMDKYGVRQSLFNQLLGILRSCKTIPTKVEKVVAVKAEKPENTVNFHNTISQSQAQSQSQEIAINIFLEAIRDDLTGKQIKEIKEILQTEKDIEKAKPKLIDKILSFGSNVGASILANLITNSSIIGSL